MKVYGHLRDQHSVEMAQKVTFSNPHADEVVPQNVQKALDVTNDETALAADLPASQSSS